MSSDRAIPWQSMRALAASTLLSWSAGGDLRLCVRLLILYVPLQAAAKLLAHADPFRAFAETADIDPGLTRPLTITGVVLGQWGLLAAWAVLGRTYWPWRQAVGMALAVVLFVDFHAPSLVRPFALSDALAVPLVLLVMQLPFWLVRLPTGLHLLRGGSRAGPQGRWFAVRHLLAAVGIIAVAAGLARWAVALSGDESLAGGALADALWLSGVAAFVLVLPTVGACLGCRFPVGIALVAIVTWVLVVTLGLSWRWVALDHALDKVTSVLPMVGLPLLAMLIPGLLLLLACGYTLRPAMCATVEDVPT